MRKIFYFISFILIHFIASGFLQGQETNSADPENTLHFRQVLGLNAEYGQVIPTNEYLRGEYEDGEALSNYGSLSLAFGWHSRGEKLWHQVYGNPGWGLGVSHASFGRPDDLGAPWAFYGYFEGPFKRWKRISIRYHFRMGLSMGWIPYDQEDNPYQISIGANRAFYGNLRVFIQYELSRFFSLNAGISISHFSNGSTAKPNKGINMFAPNLGINYYFRHDLEDVDPMIAPKYKPNWEWLAAFTFGQKRVVFDTTNSIREIDRKYIGVDCNIYGLTSTVYWQFAYKSKIGAGVDFFYDESINTKINPETGEVMQQTGVFSDQIAMGIYPSYELVINNLSLFVQSGFYILRKKQPHKTPSFYQRLGVKYHVIKNVFVGINIKAYNFQVADFIEWNAGYRLRWHDNN